MENKLNISPSEDSKLNISNKLTLEGLLFIKPPPVFKTTVLAGTSLDGLLLTSDIITNSGKIPNVVFSSLGTENLGNITDIGKCINYSTSTENIIYVTDEGYCVNYTEDSSVQISNYSITGFYGESYYGLLAGDSNGGNYQSYDGGSSWSSTGYNLSGNQVNAILSHTFEQ